MNKILLGAALGLFAAGSLAFYPNTVQHPAAPTVGTQMMVIGNFTLNTFSADANVTTIMPDGQQTEQAVEVKIRSAEKLTTGFVEVQKAMLGKINELSASGWHVVSVAPSSFSKAGTTFVSQTTYILEKR